MKWRWWLTLFTRSAVLGLQNAWLARYLWIIARVLDPPLRGSPIRVSDTRADHCSQPHWDTWLKTCSDRTYSSLSPAPCSSGPRRLSFLPLSPLWNVSSCLHPSCYPSIQTSSPSFLLQSGQSAAELPSSPPFSRYCSLCSQSDVPKKINQLKAFFWSETFRGSLILGDLGLISYQDIQGHL